MKIFGLILAFFFSILFSLVNSMYAEEAIPAKLEIPVSIPIIQKDELLGYVSLQVIIICENIQARTEIESHIARFTNAILIDLNSVLGALWFPDSTVSTEFLQKRLDTVIRKVAPSKWVKEIRVDKLQIAFPKKHRM